MERRYRYGTGTRATGFGTGRTAMGHALRVPASGDSPLWDRHSGCRLRDTHARRADARYGTGTPRRTAMGQALRLPASGQDARYGTGTPRRTAMGQALRVPASGHARTPSSRDPFFSNACPFEQGPSIWARAVVSPESPAVRGQEVRAPLEVGVRGGQPRLRCPTFRRVPVLLKADCGGRGGLIFFSQVGEAQDGGACGRLTHSWLCL